MGRGDEVQSRGGQELRARLLESSSVFVVVAACELVDSVVAAIDTNRVEEVARVRSAFEFVRLDEAFRQELRLSGVPSRCDGECWAEVA